MPQGHVGFGVLSALVASVRQTLYALLRLFIAFVIISLRLSQSARKGFNRLGFCMLPAVLSIIRRVGYRRATTLTAIAVVAMVSAFWDETPPHAGQTYELTGKVVRVADGDTLTLLDGDNRDGANHKIRLASIDTPEKKSGSSRPGQPYAKAATQYLADRVAGQIIQVTCYETDRYGRHICDIPLADQPPLTTVNQALVLAGFAWANQQAGGKYLRDDSLLDLQAEAKAQKRGLWAQPNAVAPWVWRVKCWRKGQCAQ